MTTATEQTIGQWLESLATSNESGDNDGVKMQNLLHRIGFPSAVVTCGIVYLDGQGTIDAPPTAINSIAKMLVSRANR